MYRINEKAVAWLPREEIEPKALDQIRIISAMPFIHRHIAVMPDCHLGLGATVGSVIPTVGAIIPAAVGVDIGCGMIAVRTALARADLPADLAPLRESIERRIPLSVGGRNRSLYATAVDKVRELADRAGPRRKLYDSIAPHWQLQLGSLGSGNHFIEVVEDRNDAVWAFLHSGSRGVGNRAATHHIQEAQRLCKSRKVDLPHADLAFLEEGTQEFADYIEDLRWCQEYALANREVMMDRVLAALAEAYFGDHTRDLERVQTIQCHHNFTENELHFGKRAWVSRKGAISAYPGQLGLIPGSMGTRSYVVSGLGNAESFCSAPHGAGRQFSRTEARRRFTMIDFERSMQGIEVKHDADFLDELPGAYKDVDHVIRQSASLVEVVNTFRQVVNVKGASGRSRSPRVRKKRR